MKTDVIQRTILGLICGYEFLLLPVIHMLGASGFGCRCYPNGSKCTMNAVRCYGVIRGLGLAVRRILNCQCMGWQGSDPLSPTPS